MLCYKTSTLLFTVLGCALGLGGPEMISPALDTQTFLDQHPDIPVGREALASARQNFDDTFTFTAVTKPAANAILVQAFQEGSDPSDLESALYSVVLVHDQKAEDYFAKLSRHEDDLYAEEQPSNGKRASCDGCPGRICQHRSGKSIFERASSCNQFCGSVRDCTGDWRCPSCYYVGGSCRWQKRCRPRDDF